MKNWKRALFVVLVLKLLLIGVPLRTPDGGILVDSQSYLDLARNLDKSGRYRDPEGGSRDLVRPPGYPAIVFAAQKLIANTTWPIILVQLILLSACSLLLLWLGSLVNSPSVGLIAAWLFALSPNAALWSLTVMTEISFTFMLLTSSILIIGGMRTKELWWFALSGIALGAAIYIRPIGLIVGPVWVFFLILFIRKLDLRYSMKAVGLFIATILLVVLPWFVRNARVHGRFEFSSVSQKTLLGFNLAEVISQSEGIPRNEAVDRLEETSGPIAEAITIVRQHPLDFIKVQALGIIRTGAGTDIGTWGNVLGWDTWKGFGLISSLFNRSVDYGTNPFEASSSLEGLLHRGLLSYSLLYSTVLILLVMAGISLGVTAPSISQNYWLAFATAVVLIVIPLASGQARFRVPAEPFLTWLAASGACWIAKRKFNASSENRA